METERDEEGAETAAWGRSGRQAGAAEQRQVRGGDRDGETHLARDRAETRPGQQCRHFIIKMVSMIKTWCVQQRAGRLAGGGGHSAGPRPTTELFLAAKGTFCNNIKYWDQGR